YRIRYSQEDDQLLCESAGWNDFGRGDNSGPAPDPDDVGASAATALGRGHGSHLFTGWIYDVLKPIAQELKVAHPAMLKAIVASKKKNDKVDARRISDLLRCNLLPECYMAPRAIRDLRRMLRYVSKTRRKQLINGCYQSGHEAHPVGI